MNKKQTLQLRQDKLKQQITDRLDLLIGSIHKTPSQTGYHLTTKVEGKSVTKYVRQSLVPQAQAMTENHLQVRALLRQLSQVNWQLLQLSQDEDPT